MDIEGSAWFEQLAWEAILDGKFEKAILLYNKAIELNPNADGAYFDRANSYKELKEYHKALTDHNKAIELNPSNVYYYAGRADCYEQLEQYENAIKDYTKVIELNPRACYYFYRAKCYFKLTDYIKTKENCEYAVKKCKDDVLLREEERDEIIEFYNSIKTYFSPKQANKHGRRLDF